jgi:hypothetical protein
MKHEPIRTPRDMTGEQVFARRWKDLMESKVSFGKGILGIVLMGYPYPIGQREAAVAASMICWLGTNIGQSFLTLGMEIRDRTSCGNYAYIAAWGVRNARVFGHGSNARQIEFLVRTHEEMEDKVFSEVSIRDLEVLDQVALWLGTDGGQNFLKSCEEEIERRKDLEDLVFQSAAGRHDSPRVRTLVDKFAIVE